jgi:hypothetical protein
MAGRTGVIHLADYLPHLDWALLGVWTLTLLLLIVGLIGSVVPFVPGPLIILVGCVLHAWLRPQSGFGWWSVAGEAGLVILAHVIDFLSGAMGSKWFGGSRWGTAGVLLGGLVGLFFGLPGLILGPLIGGFVFELVFAGKELAHAAKSTFGAATGIGMGLLARLIIAGAMIGWFLWATLKA